MDSRRLQQLLPVSRGEVPADLVIKNVVLANVLSLEYEKVDIAVADGIIAGVGEGYEGRQTVDAEGRVLIPGMIDGHIHIESTMLTPARFAEVVVPRGTTAVMADPHEIGNVWGADGIRAMSEAAQGLPLDFFWAASSCVPASEFEACREPLGASELQKLLHQSVCHHLGEMMNFPGVIAGDSDVWNKLAVARNYPLTAHGPRVSGKNLCAYLLSGCLADHESTSYTEALEKLRRGGWVMMRSGAATNDLPTIAPLLIESPQRCSRFMTVSDDLTPTVLTQDGHLDAKMREMCRLGIPPLVALRTVTLSPAEYFHLDRCGAIAPGWQADMALVDSLENCQVYKVWKRGEMVAEKGMMRPWSGAAKPMDWTGRIAPISLSPLNPSDISVSVQPEQNSQQIRVIGWRQGSLLTDSLIEEARLENGKLMADLTRDIVKLAVRGRNQPFSKVAVGFVKGLGLQKGALASSIAHDAHPFIAAGVDDGSILTALEWLRQKGGGIVVCEGTQILASLPLPVAGLMSDQSAAEVSDGLNKIDQVLKKMGVVGQHPCMALSFLSLSVIPYLKLTDGGLVNLVQGGWQSLLSDQDSNSVEVE